jgi:hypothetical protein
MLGMGEQPETAEEALEVTQSTATDVPEESGSRGCIGSVSALAGVVLGGLYLTNPTAGLIELIPDTIPLFGNLDEAAATTMLVLGLQYLFGRRR